MIRHGRYQDTTQTLPLAEHLILHVSQIKQKSQHPCHPLHKLTKQNHTPKVMKRITLNNITNPNTTTMADISANQKTMHSAIVTKHLTKINHNKILQALPPNICSSEETLPRHTRRALAKPRTNKSPFLKSYLHKIDSHKHPSPLCLLCKTGAQTTPFQLPTHMHSVVTSGFLDEPRGCDRAGIME